MNPTDSVSGPKLGLWQRAFLIRGHAMAVLNGRSGRYSRRLTLSLAVILILTVSIALYAAVACLSMTGYILFDGMAWVDIACNGLLLLLGLVFVLPLMGSLWRMACLMTAPDGEVVDGLPVSAPQVTLTELFYPFTSLRAYGRTMAVMAESLLFLLAGLGVPILAFRLASHILDGVADFPPLFRTLILAAVVFLGIGWGFLVFLISGCRAGLGYFVFVHENMLLTDVCRYYRCFRRPLFPAFCLRVSLLGWVALSVAGICVPFVFHTIPYGLCCFAQYGRTLNRVESAP